MVKSRRLINAAYQGHRKGRGLSLSTHAPFVGCDGEGAGIDSIGRQNYMLLRMGDRELYTGKPLSTIECLGHICDAEPGFNYVGFAFGYDVTMILRDLPPERRVRVLQAKDRGNGKSPYTYFDTFGIDYLPRNYLSVCRVEPGPDRTLRRVEGTRRTIWETFGFFQTSFVRSLKNFGVGLDKLEQIEKMKAAREDFETMSAEIRDYCRLECQYLAEMMETLRGYCIGADIVPRTWSGAGKLAARMHADHKTTRRDDIAVTVPPEVLTMAQAAYYGGRFEVTRIGNIPGPIYEYDIRSAYPDAMRHLPCLIHGKWKPFDGGGSRTCLPGDLYVCAGQFDHRGATGSERIMLCGLPIRSKKGHIFWPLQGRGIYWSAEIDAARLLGCRVRIGAGYVYERTCECEAFNWVEPLYEYRKKVGSKTIGYPIKLGLNSLYGKLAQRVGSPTYGNFIWAGIITAKTRGKLMTAAALAPQDIVMLATDGVYSRVPLDLPLGDNLGQWEAAVHDRMFIVQPGLYWGPPKPKTRGVPLKFFETRTDEFENRWREFRELDTAASIGSLTREYPTAKIELQSFIGLKLAQARNKPETAGMWVRPEREISFDWTRKRKPEHIWEGDHVITFPLPGSPELCSVMHGGIDETVLGQWEGARMEIEDQPDVVDLSIPWKD